jgi:hypothetical protein
MDVDSSVAAWDHASAVVSRHATAAVRGSNRLGRPCRWLSVRRNTDGAIPSGPLPLWVVGSASSEAGAAETPSNMRFLGVMLTLGLGSSEEIWVGTLPVESFENFRPRYPGRHIMTTFRASSTEKRMSCV